MDQPSEAHTSRPAGGAVRRLHPPPETPVETSESAQSPPHPATTESEAVMPGSSNGSAAPALPSVEKNSRPARDGSGKLFAQALFVVLVLAAIGVCAVFWPVQTLIVTALLLLASPYAIAYIMRRNGKSHTVNGLVPRHGPRSLFWRLIGSQLYDISGWQWLSKPSLHDREHQALDALWEQKRRQKIVTFLNSKGGSAKTAMCVWLAALLAEAIRQPPLAFDVNESPGGTAKRLGIDRKATITLRAYLRDCAEGRLQSLHELLTRVEWHRQTGVRVIASEATDDESFDIEMMKAGLRVLKTASHSVFCDCGNAIKAPGNWGAVAMSDTLVFTGNVNMADSLADINSTMHRYRSLGHGPQVQRCIIVIVGAKLEQRATFAKSYGVPTDRVFVVPPNRYMAKGEPVDLTKIPLQIRVILLEILVAIMTAESVRYDDFAQPTTGTTAEPATGDLNRRPRPHPDAVTVHPGA